MRSKHLFLTSALAGVFALAHAPPGQAQQAGGGQRAAQEAPTSQTPSQQPGGVETGELTQVLGRLSQLLGQQQGGGGQSGAAAQGQVDDQRLAQETAIIPGTPLFVSPAGVRQVQQALNNLGYFAGPVDGQWNLLTAQAAANFQQAHGLEPTGTLDLSLIAALGVGDRLAPTQPRRTAQGPSGQQQAQRGQQQGQQGGQQQGQQGRRQQAQQGGQRQQEQLQAGADADEIRRLTLVLSRLVEVLSEQQANAGQGRQAMTPGPQQGGGGQRDVQTGGQSGQTYFFTPGAQRSGAPVGGGGAGDGNQGGGARQGGGAGQEQGLGRRSSRDPGPQPTAQARQGQAADPEVVFVEPDVVLVPEDTGRSQRGGQARRSDGGQSQMRAQHRQTGEAGLTNQTGQTYEFGQPRVQTSQAPAGSVTGVTTGVSGPESTADAWPGTNSLPKPPRPELCDPFREQPVAYQSCLSVVLRPGPSPLR